MHVALAWKLDRVISKQRSVLSWKTVSCFMTLSCAHTHTHTRSILAAPMELKQGNKDSIMQSSTSVYLWTCLFLYHSEFKQVSLPLTFFYRVSWWAVWVIMEVMKGIRVLCYRTVMTLHYISALLSIKSNQRRTQMEPCKAKDLNTERKTGSLKVFIIKILLQRPKIIHASYGL